MSKSHLNLSNARNKKQKSRMEKINRDGVCPFCPENILKYHKKPIIKNGRWWSLTENDFPYKGSSVHLLAIYKKHINNISEISSGAIKELMDLLNKFILENKIKGASLFVRLGDTDYTGGTVEHLHVHLLSGGRKQKNKKSVKVKLGYFK